MSARTTTPSPKFQGERPRMVWVALGTIYVIWSSTYLAIRLAIDTMPPLLMAATRFLVAGALLYAWSIRRGDRQGDRPGRREWLGAVIIGGLLLFGGNGGVSLAEKTVPTGVVALIIAMIPLWLALLDRVVHKQRLAPQAIVGLVLGFGGLVLLVGVPSNGQSLDLPGVLIALGASLSWSIGSIFARRAPLPRRPLLSNGMQMLAGGALLAVAGLAGGELGRLEVSRISVQSLLAVAYLVVFGSVIAFSAYMYLLRVAPISMVGTYAYVNPVLAVFLGWAFLDEVITARTFLAGAIIVAAVAMIVTARKLPAADAASSGQRRGRPAVAGGG